MPLKQPVGPASMHIREHPERQTPGTCDSPVPGLPSLTLAMVEQLLHARGYGLVCRFGHVHALHHTQEWHVCLLTDLATMRPPALLACLEEALSLRIKP